MGCPGKLLLLLLALTLLAWAASVPSDGDGLELACGGACVCWSSRSPHHDVYRVTCNNTGYQAVYLSDRVFHPDGIPSWRRHTQVSIHSIPAVTISPRFVASWTAYSSCVLDIQQGGYVTFPRDVVPRGPSHAINHEFAGLHVTASQMTDIPLGLFTGKYKTGLRLENVTVAVLNFQNIVETSSNSLQYLHMVNCTVGILQDPSPVPMMLVSQLFEGHHGVRIVNSKIGIGVLVIMVMILVALLAFRTREREEELDGPQLTHGTSLMYMSAEDYTDPWINYPSPYSQYD